MMIVKITLALVALFLLLIAALVFIIQEDRRSEHLSTHTVTTPPDSEYFCLALNRPVKYLDFQDMPGCEPGKCKTCALAVFRDI